MKKIPTLFEREYDQKGNFICLTNKVRTGLAWVLNNEGIATIKYDGACCAIINGELYKRYDAKNGKPIPKDAIICQEEADMITGHMPCFVKCNRNNPADKWFIKAYELLEQKVEGTYEAIGLHFNSNPYKMDYDIMIPHGKDIVNVERTYEGIKKYLEENYIEGLVFWKDNEPCCKIRRKDFGFKWNC